MEPITYTVHDENGTLEIKHWPLFQITVQLWKKRGITINIRRGSSDAAAKQDPIG